MILDKWKKIMTKTRLIRLLCIGLVVTLFSNPTNASVFDLSFAGTVDNSGARLGGVDAPLGSPFSLDIRDFFDF